MCPSESRPNNCPRRYHDSRTLYRHRAGWFSSHHHTGRYSIGPQRDSACGQAIDAVAFVPPKNAVWLRWISIFVFLCVLHALTIRIFWGRFLCGFPLLLRLFVFRSHTVPAFVVPAGFLVLRVPQIPERLERLHLVLRHGVVLRAFSVILRLFSVVHVLGRYVPESILRR